MSIQTTQPIYATLLANAKDLITAIERSAGDEIIQNKQRNIVMLTEVATSLTHLDREQAESIRKLQQLNVQHQIQTIEGLLELQKKLQDGAVEELSRQLASEQAKNRVTEQKIHQMSLYITFLERELSRKNLQQGGKIENPIKVDDLLDESIQ